MRMPKQSRPFGATSPARWRCFPPDGQAAGSSALGHNESRIFAISTGFLPKNTDAWPENLFSSTDSLSTCGVCINDTAVCVNAIGVYTSDTAVYRISRRRLYFFPAQKLFISFCIRFLPLYGIRPLMSCTRTAFFKSNARNLYYPH